MTDKEKLDKLINEIKRFRKEVKDNITELGNSESERVGLFKDLEIYDNILSFIDSMQEEPVSEEFKIALEKKVREAQDWTYIEEEGGECPLNEEFGAYDLEEFARWGAEWQITKLVEEAGEHEVKVDAGGYPYIPQIELYDYIKDIPLAKEGDKYKVILIKED